MTIDGRSLEAERGKLIMIKPEPFNAEAPPEALNCAITPTDLHYVRSNFALPEHDGTLHVGGAVDRPLVLTLEDLQAMPAVTRAVTFECAGNGRLGQSPMPIGEPWGWYAVSTAEWTGALLSEVLEQAGPQANGVDVLFEGADHGPYHEYDDIAFMRSLSLSHAIDPSAEIIIAYEMNGEPLPADHGAPLRLVVPRWYGVASVKWLKRIAVVPEKFEGEFQVGHYMYEWPDQPHEPVTLMRVRARITDPAPAAVIPAGSYVVRGKAWSGAGAIANVEVSFGGAKEWNPARVSPSDGPYQWQEWTCDWSATSPGRHTIRARATDTAGHTQPESPPWNRLGYGNNAIEILYVDVR
jgi:DMSO/TMAO reductase YedYZ molybdopterin-dependent catalytic subunit